MTITIISNIVFIINIRQWLKALTVIRTFIIVIVHRRPITLTIVTIKLARSVTIVFMVIIHHRPLAFLTTSEIERSRASRGGPLHLYSATRPFAWLPRAPRADKTGPSAKAKTSA